MSPHPRPSPAVPATAADRLAPAARPDDLHATWWATTHSETASTRAHQPRPSPHTAPSARLATFAALRNQGPAAYIPQQPRASPPWRRFSPTRFTRRHRQRCVCSASVGRRINAFRCARLAAAGGAGPFGRCGGPGAAADVGAGPQRAAPLRCRPITTPLGLQLLQCTVLAGAKSRFDASSPTGASRAPWPLRCGVPGTAELPLNPYVQQGCDPL